MSVKSRLVLNMTGRTAGERNFIGSWHKNIRSVDSCSMALQRMALVQVGVTLILHFSCLSTAMVGLTCMISPVAFQGADLKLR